MFNMKSCLIKFVCLFALFSLFQSCENKLEMTLPQGPKGDKGDKGDPGLSAFDLWKEYYGKDSSTTLEDFFNSLKGKDGKDGAVPIIGGNNNWWIDGVDTGILARGTDGKDGVTPVIGSNGNWHIDGKDTGVPARGQDGIDGEDGLTPYIKDGNWWIGDQDTKVPAEGKDGEDGVTPTVKIGPGPNYYWIINETETTISAKGKDGVNGKTSYELWIDAVNDGKMTNKDGTPYTGGDTWEEFLRWLQGGDVSVLHQYWLSIPGNTGDINEFLELLFSCHCDGVTVTGVVPYTYCVELNTDGTPKKYEATLNITSEKEGKYTIKVGDKILKENQPLKVGQNDIKITQTAEAQMLDIICTVADKVVTKNVQIPALKYIAGASTRVEAVNDSISKAIITLTDVTNLTAILVGADDILDSASEWTKSDDGKTYSKEYKRGAQKQTLNVSVKGKNGECTTLKYEIPSLTPVNVDGKPRIVFNGDCLFTLIAEGTPGMTVIAKVPNILPAEGQRLTETTTNDPNKSEYSIVLPRKYTKYTVSLTATKEGFGNATASAVIEGSYLLQDPLTVDWPDNDLASSEGKMKAEVRAQLKNTSSKPIKVTIARTDTPSGVQSRTPWVKGPGIAADIAVGGVAEVVIEAEKTVDLIFQRDFRSNFTSGNYKVTMASVNGCDERKEKAAINIPYQQNYRYDFELPSGAGGPDPNGNISFVMNIYDALPNKYLQFQLTHANGALNSVIFGEEKTDSKGNYTKTVTMKYEDFLRAEEVGKGHFIFSDKEGAAEPLLKSEIDFKFD